MELHAEKTERSFIKLVIGGLFGLILFIALTVTAVYFFHRWQERHLVRVAAAYLSGGDMKAAALSARRVLQMNPGNLEAARLVAQIAERSGDPAAVDWWRKVVDLQPHNTADALALVRSALRLNDLAIAEKTLASIDEVGKRTAAYHAASGRLAEIRKNLVESESHWAKASEIEPENAAYRFQLALIRLGSNDPAKREAAQRTLERLRADPKQRTSATRTLILDGVAHHVEVKRLQVLAAELQSYPEATLSDRLLYLEILRQLHDPALGEYLKKIEQEVASNPVDLTSLLSWMSGNDTAAEGLEFSKGVPAETLAKWPVPSALGELYLSVIYWLVLDRK